MAHYLKLIDADTGGPRCDVTPLFGDYTAFAALPGIFTTGEPPMKGGRWPGAGAK